MHIFLFIAIPQFLDYNADMNWDIIGHEWAVTMLRQHIQKDKQQHAYLFSGAPGIGKRTLALKFAQAINCTQSTTPGEPCGICRDCKQIAAMQHPDLSLIHDEDNSGKIKVNQIRELQHSLSLAPYQAKFRIALLQDFETANANAQNALLKTLEEAPPRVVLLLTCTSAESLLPTIVSRCEILRLRPLSLQVLQEELTEKWQVPMQKAQQLAHLTSGRLGQALQYHQDEHLLEQVKVFQEDLSILLKSNIRDRFSYAELAAQEKIDLHFRFETWLSLWRDMLHMRVGSQAPLINLEMQDELNFLCHQMEISEINEQASAMENAINQLETNQNPRLLTEVLLLNWPMIS